MRLYTTIACVFFFSTISNVIEAKRGVYSTSYVFLTATNRIDGKSEQVCVNYQQFMKVPIAENVEQAQPYPLSWWRHKAQNSAVCPLPEGREKSITYSGKAVPLKYRIDDDSTDCTMPFLVNGTAFRTACQFMVNKLTEYNSSVALFLVDRGRQYVMGWKDYLFSEFFDPFTKTDLPTFFMYNDIFQSKILGLSMNIDDIDLRFHRPPQAVFDFSMVVMWLLAMTCVAGGGFWAFHRHKLGKDVSVREKTVEELENEKKSWVSKYGNFISIGILMVFLVTVITLGYFYRNVLVYFFNALLVVFGSFSVHGCVMALLSNFHFSKSEWYNSDFTCFVFCGKRFKQASSMVYIPSLFLCIIWFIWRRSPYAFILLDFINVTLCLHILKSLRLPSLKWIATLLVCMFIYDALMVFGTPFWTKNGCSVMLEVATGLDCSANTNGTGFPLPPVEYNLPEKFPMLMQVLHFDTMLECVDLSIEKGYQMSILGLGDIIIPGYLVVYSFTMDDFAERTRLIYGFVALVGYGVGLIVTFLALIAVESAQPALVYLVPCTLLPICFLALCRGEFMKMWNGQTVTIIEIPPTNQATNASTSALKEDDESQIIPSNENV